MSDTKYDSWICSGCNKIYSMHPGMEPHYPCDACGKRLIPLGTERNDNLAEVIDERVNVYGRPEEMFPRMAAVWSGIIGHEVTAEQVVLCMIGYKLVRASQTPDYSDNSDDVEGYLDIFRTLVGEDMVHARSVTEYLEKRGRGRG